MHVPVTQTQARCRPRNRRICWQQTEQCKTLRLLVLLVHGNVNHSEESCLVLALGKYCDRAVLVAFKSSFLVPFGTQRLQYPSNRE